MSVATRHWLRLAAAAVTLAVVFFFVHQRTTPRPGGGGPARAPGPGEARAATTQTSSPSQSPSQAPGAPRPVPVLLAGVETRDVPVWIEGLGTAAAVNQVTVRTQVDGRLDRVYFREGQSVRHGERLAQIDPRPFLAQLHTAEGGLARDRAQLIAAKANLARYHSLRQQNLIAQQQVDDQAALVGQLDGTVRIDLAAAESARLSLDYASIRSPSDGVLGVRLVDPGNVVHPGDASGLVVVTQLDPAAVYFSLSEDELPRIAAAQRKGSVPVEAFSRDGSTRLGSGTLTVLDNQVNQATATLKLKALMPNRSGLLWPGQFVKARILVDTVRGARVVPAATIQRGPQGTFVYVVGGDQAAQMRPVEVQQIAGDTAIIGRGLEVGEQVVLEGQGQLRPGSVVQSVVQSKPATEAGKPGGEGKGAGTRKPGASGKDGKDSGRGAAHP